MTLHFSFRAANYGALKRRDLVGDYVTVALVDDGSLGLFGEKDGTVRLLPTDIERVRIGVIEGKRRVFYTKIWPANGDKPFELIPSSAEWPAYSRVIRRYVEMLAEKHMTDRIIVGSSKFDAIMPIVLFGLLATGAMLVSIFALRREPWWGRMIVPLLPVGVLGVFIWLTVTRTWPRPMEDISQLDRQLPRQAL